MFLFCYVSQCQGYLISITGDNTINQWSLREQPARRAQPLPLDDDEKYAYLLTYILII